MESNEEFCARVAAPFLAQIAKLEEANERLHDKYQRLQVRYGRLENSLLRPLPGAEPETAAASESSADLWRLEYARAFSELESRVEEKLDEIVGALDLLEGKKRRTEETRSVQPWSASGHGLAADIRRYAAIPPALELFRAEQKLTELALKAARQVRGIKEDISGAERDMVEQADRVLDLRERPETPRLDSLENAVESGGIPVLDFVASAFSIEIWRDQGGRAYFYDRSRVTVELLHWMPEGEALRKVIRDNGLTAVDFRNLDRDDGSGPEEFEVIP